MLKRRVVITSLGLLLPTVQERILGVFENKFPVRFALVHTEPRAWLPVVVGQPEARAFSQPCFQTALRLTLNASLRESFCPGNNRAQEKTTSS